jgi:hypothetical protein
MEVRLQPEKEAQLTRIAAQRGVTTEELAREIICRYLGEDKSSAPAPVARGGLGTEIAALFRGHGLEHPIPQLKITIESPFAPSPKKSSGLRPADSRGRLSPHKPSRGRRKKRA